MRKKSKPYNSKHGLTSHPMYIRWQLLKDRCYNKNHNRYIYYGARGIKVCDRWKDSFIAFYEDMGSKPFPKGDTGHWNLSKALIRRYLDAENIFGLRT